MILTRLLVPVLQTKQTINHPLSVMRYESWTLALRKLAILPN
jgi:hypothetical protein